MFRKFDDNIRKELVKMGIDGDELDKRIRLSKNGNLAKYLRDNGKRFTFGMLNAIFKDALQARKSTEVIIGSYKMFHRIVPILMAPFYPVLAIIGYILGTSRAINKILVPLLSEPGNEYPTFLKRLIVASMRISEGDLNMKDRFSRAFVVSDDIVSAIKPEVIHKFSLFLSKKMSLEDQSSEVPDNYVENELKEYINREFSVDPPIPLKK